MLITSHVFSKSAKIIEKKQLSFNPFLCSELKTDHLRINEQNECLIIQKLNNTYAIKSNDYDKNTWHRPQIIKYLNNENGNKIITHSWNNVVQWGDESNKQPFSHLAVLNINNLDNLFTSKEEINSNKNSLLVRL